MPLLEFALDELYKRRTSDGLLTFEAYRGHLDGSIVLALAKRVDATLNGLPELSRTAFRSVMRRLATTVDDTAAESAKGAQRDLMEEGSSGVVFQRQRVPYDQLTASPPGAKALIDAFVAARLLVVETTKADDQKAEVTVAHESLFEHWTALKNLLLAERDDFILPRAKVAASHERWRAENRTGDFNTSGTRIVTASEDGFARVWNAADGALVGILGPSKAIPAAAFSLPGERIVTAAAFSPRGERIVTASADGTAQIWDAETFVKMGPILRHNGRIKEDWSASLGCCDWSNDWSGNETQRGCQICYLQSRWTTSADGFR